MVYVLTHLQIMYSLAHAQIHIHIPILVLIPIPISFYIIVPFHISIPINIPILIPVLALVLALVCVPDAPFLRGVLDVTYHIPLSTRPLYKQTCKSRRKLLTRQDDTPSLSNHSFIHSFDIPSFFPLLFPLICIGSPLVLIPFSLLGFLALICLFFRVVCVSVLSKGIMS